MMIYPGRLYICLGKFLMKFVLSLMFGDVYKLNLVSKNKCFRERIHNGLFFLIQKMLLQLILLNQSSFLDRIHCISLRLLTRGEKKMWGKNENSYLSVKENTYDVDPSVQDCNNLKKPLLRNNSFKRTLCTLVYTSIMFKSYTSLYFEHYEE
ncbi:hypothetical protein QTP88_024274 [Uroleucon formosanum]